MGDNILPPMPNSMTSSSKKESIKGVMYIAGKFDQTSMRVYTSGDYCQCIVAYDVQQLTSSEVVGHVFPYQHRGSSSSVGGIVDVPNCPYIVEHGYRLLIWDVSGSTPKMDLLNINGEEKGWIDTSSGMEPGGGKKYDPNS